MAPTKNQARIPAECCCFNLRKVTRAVTQYYDTVLAPTGLRSTQFNLLVAISMSDGITLGQLATSIVMDRTTLSRNLRPLERQGLISIARGDDRRERVIRLTQAGRAMIDEILPLWEGAQSKIVREIGEGEWPTTLGALHQVLSATRSVMSTRPSLG